jgi:DNA-binding NarL/FixJ family response regulator
MTRVLLVDDQALVRAGFRMILRAEPDIEVVGEAGHGLEAIELARALEPDVVLMDLRMPELDGIEATRRIVDGTEGPRVLVPDDVRPRRIGLRSPARRRERVLAQGCARGAARRGIKVVADGGSLFAPAVTKRLIERFAGAAPSQAGDVLSGLTPREVEVLRLVA